jgi:hypothetical protein
MARRLIGNHLSISLSLFLQNKFKPASAQTGPWLARRWAFVLAVASIDLTIPRGCRVVAR